MRAALFGLMLLPAVASATEFRTPLVQSQCGWAGGCFVSAYFDLNRSNGYVRDWACGIQTYDNHTGVDIAIGGFAAMDQGRDVLAAAPGRVIAAHDGEFDRCDSQLLNAGQCGAPNYVWLQHADGKITMYYHLKKFSVAVAVGQQVACGQKLGQVGSSGYSTGPHVHFQTNTSTDPNAFDDPYAGTTTSCGGSFSWWVSQGSYKALPGFVCENAPMPDVVVSSLTMTPSAPRAGDAVRFTAVVTNQGNASTGDQVGIGFFVGGTQPTYAIRPAMAAGETVTLTSVGTWTASTGTHSVEAFVDDVNRFAEANEANNKRSASIVVQARPDLSVTALTPASAVQGDSVAFSATVKNSGGSVGASVVSFSVDGLKIGEAAVPALAASASATVSLSTGWLASPGTFSVEALADSGSSHGESNESNNARVISVVVAPLVVGAGPFGVSSSEAGSLEEEEVVEVGGEAVEEAASEPSSEPGLATGGVGCSVGGFGSVAWLGGIALLSLRRGRFRRRSWRYDGVRETASRT